MRWWEWISPEHQILTSGAAQGQPLRRARDSPGRIACHHKGNLATRTGKLLWLFVSERQAQLTRRAVNYIAPLCGQEAKLAGHSLSLF
jgi:hypothetical protein